MKTLHDEDLSTRPIYVMPGDTVEVTYNDPGGKTHRLAAATVDKAMVVDRIKIARFKKGEVRGFKSGLVAVLGERSR
jgi:hypothetical protein